jgi:hypothetical protein
MLATKFGVSYTGLDPVGAPAFIELCDSMAPELGFRTGDEDFCPLPLIILDSSSI